ncbi:MAG: S1-like domain-containing RNA-binding protein [Tenericutes bacterium]|nr:S1-like domain-containing RNA-binding protein [Mycoplasmatota bacterium]
MSLYIGEVNKLVVNRKTDIGYMLDSDEGEVFLHNNESLHEDLKPGQAVDAFLYFDQKARLAATLKTPYITVSQPGFLTVSDVHETLGVFLDMGIAKELLLSNEDLPLDKDEWPRVGDQLFVTIKIKNKFVAKIASKEEVDLKPTEPLNLKDKVLARVQRIGREGVNLLTPDGHWIFVHHSLNKEPLRYGQEVSVKVVYHSEKGYTGSLAPQKEVAIYDDANYILSYLIRNDGEMNLTSDSTPEEIYEVFKLSKKAFKRAIGNLYRERKIDFVDDKTILVKK